MQGDENRVRYWLVTQEQQRNELNPHIYSSCLNEEDISFALVHGSERGWGPVTMLANSVEPTATPAESRIQSTLSRIMSEREMQFLVKISVFILFV
jgi:hypothetical protein